MKLTVVVLLAAIAAKFIAAKCYYQYQPRRFRGYTWYEKVETHCDKVETQYVDLFSGKPYFNHFKSTQYQRRLWNMVMDSRVQKVERLERKYFG